MSETHEAGGLTWSVERLARSQRIIEAQAQDGGRTLVLGAHLSTGRWYLRFDGGGLGAGRIRGGGGRTLARAAERALEALAEADARWQDAAAGE